MKKALLASVAMMVMSGLTAASAADLPPRIDYKMPVVVYNWTGCYVGGNVGVAWGSANIENVTNFSNASGTNSGVAGGIQVGCDYQFNSFVIGVRNMFDGTSLSSNMTFPGGYTGDSSVRWFDTLTARVGYTVQPNLLLYFQGGAAWMRSDQTLNNAGITVGSFAHTKSGWTIGGGAEYMFAPRWAAFVEYNFMNFGSESGSWTDAAGFHSINLKRDTQNLLVGVNYRF